MKFEDLVRATGATVVDYETKLECCGGALDRVGQRESALEFCARKVEDLSGQEVDALVVACPSCFQQFDLNQAAMLRRRQKEGAGEDVGIPVLYYSELVALAMGRDPEDLGLSLHRGGCFPLSGELGTAFGTKGRDRAGVPGVGIAEV